MNKNGGGKEHKRKRTDLKPIPLITTLNVNGQNTPTKVQRPSDWIKINMIHPFFFSIKIMS